MCTFISVFINSYFRKCNNEGNTRNQSWRLAPVRGQELKLKVNWIKKFTVPSLTVSLNSNVVRLRLNRAALGEYPQLLVKGFAMTGFVGGGYITPTRAGARRILLANLCIHQIRYTAGG